MLNNEQCMGFMNKAGHIYRYISLASYRAIEKIEDTLKYQNFEFTYKLYYEMQQESGI